MIYIIFFGVCFLASIIGAICGIGGGVIIKPVLDAFGAMSVASISFLSGCTVLSMTTYSVLRNRKAGNSSLDTTVGFPLAIGAAVGGVIGKNLFASVSDRFADKNTVGAVQAASLLLVTVGTLLYTINKSRIPTLKVTNRILCALIGCALGIMSSFLGIGGGPINLVVLFFFFSMPTKTAAENSLYIIFFSQLTNLLVTIGTGRVPEFSLWVLVLMVCGGILGGMYGRKINSRIGEKTVDKLFTGLMCVIILINLYNIFKYAVC